MCSTNKCMCAPTDVIARHISRAKNFQLALVSQKLWEATPSKCLSLFWGIGWKFCTSHFNHFPSCIALRVTRLLSCFQNCWQMKIVRSAWTKTKCKFLDRFGSGPIGTILSPPSWTMLLCEESACQSWTCCSVQNENCHNNSSFVWKMTKRLLVFLWHSDCTAIVSCRLHCHIINDDVLVALLSNFLPWQWTTGLTQTGPMTLRSVNSVTWVPDVSPAWENSTGWPVLGTAIFHFNHVVFQSDSHSTLSFPMLQQTESPAHEVNVLQSLGCKMTFEMLFNLVICCCCWLFVVAVDFLHCLQLCFSTHWDCCRSQKQLQWHFFCSKGIQNKHFKGKSTWCPSTFLTTQRLRRSKFQNWFIFSSFCKCWLDFVGVVWSFQWHFLMTRWKNWSLWVVQLNCLLQWPFLRQNLISFKCTVTKESVLKQGVPHLG